MSEGFQLLPQNNPEILVSLGTMVRLYYSLFQADVSLLLTVPPYEKSVMLIHMVNNKIQIVGGPF